MRFRVVHGLASVVSSGKVTGEMKSLGLMVRTEHVARSSTCSAALPINAPATPVGAMIPITIRSMSCFFANSDRAAPGSTALQINQTILFALS